MKKKSTRKKKKAKRKEKKEEKKYCKHKYFWLTILVLVILTAVSFMYDEQIMFKITSLQSPELDGVMVGFSNLVSLAVGIPAILIVIYLLETARFRKIAISDLFVAIVIDVLLILILKMLIGRPRPFEKLTVNNIIPETFSSFPSGHSSRAFVVFGILSVFYNHKWMFYLLAIMVAFSRVYLGVHYMSDVLAGTIIGMLIAHYTIEFNLGERLTKLLRRLR